MRIVIPTVLCLALLTACSEGKFIARNTPNACGSEGYTFVIIHYGDGRIITLPIIEVAAGAELQYHLMPGPDSALVDYSAAHVDIDPKPASAIFPAPPAGAAWLEADGSVDIDGNVWSVCVPDTIPVGTQFYYTITIDNVGSLDPRADVEF